MGPRDLAAFLLERGSRALSQAADGVMRDPRGAEVVARAVGAAQRAKQRIDRLQERALHAVGLAARPDYDEVAKRMARLKRKLKELARRIEEDRPSR